MRVFGSMVLVVFALVLVYLVAEPHVVAQGKSEPAGAQWEYLRTDGFGLIKMVSDDTALPEDKKWEGDWLGRQLSQIGAEGWELVAIEPFVLSPKDLEDYKNGHLKSAKDIHSLIPTAYYFKRPKQ